MLFFNNLFRAIRADQQENLNDILRPVMDSNIPVKWPLHAGFAETLRLLPLLPFLDAVRRNIIDMIYLRSAGLPFSDIIVTVPDFGLSTILLLIGLSMFFIRWRTVAAGGLLFAGILL